MGNKSRDKNRHQKWQQRVSGAEDPNNEAAIVQPFMEALRHGMSENSYEFSQAVGLRPKDLRAIKSGNQKADIETQAKIIGAAVQIGWKLPTQENL